ncbi:hypothetical protein Ae406Ps2_6058c [Pseudonocardia sp. Ae406_Ps2]|nr:hypothetical protein Ae406Ps2_6020c [Pseudonocardia sp. Ae406_Ps2]OLL96222.1 hypothetical protein Ae406Ps2_6058c [Pseudonocardia sp. Ae406_Ps2]OLM08587.1 hypothetical protein Ae505Ps2_5974c [Pseudonocardia sp. Ae505_Ps2]OLM08591.1 hypothetical protein Ae505Ps2_5978c [Pseudonocardia sp. Ae505_Ps2]OLM08601.1 hypothetical protein Ae505Ps2_5988c [Pseudonocardia sp. Ae505_Ps2]
MPPPSVIAQHGNPRSRIVSDADNGYARRAHRCAPLARRADGVTTDHTQQPSTPSRAGRFP